MRIFQATIFEHPDLTDLTDSRMKSRTMIQVSDVQIADSVHPASQRFEKDMWTEIWNGPSTSVWHYSPNIVCVNSLGVPSYQRCRCRWVARCGPNSLNFDPVRCPQNCHVHWGLMMSGFRPYTRQTLPSISEKQKQDGKPHNPHLRALVDVAMVLLSGHPPEELTCFWTGTVRPL